MKLLLFIFSMLLLSNRPFCQTGNKKEQGILDSLKNIPQNVKLTYNKIKELSQSTIQVKVISSCSTKPELCGTVAFGSSCMVSIENGKYQGDILIIATSCGATNYTTNKIYTLQIEEAPGFSVLLCDMRSYYLGWNTDIEKNKHILLFGRLK